MVYKNAQATSAKMKEIQEEIAKDSCLIRIVRYATEGWTTRRDQIAADVKPQQSNKEKLSMINGLLFKGEGLIIPASMRKEVLKQLQQAHMGIERSKWRARVTIFWPQINQQIEEIVKTCNTYIHNQRKQSCEPMLPSDVPHYPFQIVEIDLFHWNGQDFVLVVDIGTADIGKLRHYIRLMQQQQ